jgi:predicted porin
MKKIALAVLATLITPVLHAAQIYDQDGNVVDLYGSLRARHYFSDNTAIDGDNTFLRLGFKGQTQINDYLTGYGQWEYQFNGNNSAGSDANNGSNTRLAFAGLQFDKFGSLDYGRNWGIGYDVASYTDVAPIFDDLTYAFADNFMTSRATGVLTYRNNGFFGLVDGLNVATQYQGANDAETANARTAATKANGDGYGFSTSYTTDFHVSVGGVYTSSERTTEQQALTYGRGDKADMWAGGLKYDNNGVYIAGLYGESHNMAPIKSVGFANKSQNVEAIASYLFDFGLKPMFGYFQSKAEDVEHNVGDAYLVKYYEASMTYYFNKNMNAYVDYKINLLDKDNALGIASANEVGLGLNYQF